MCIVIGINGEGRIAIHVFYVTNRKMAPVHQMVTEKTSEGGKGTF